MASRLVRLRALGLDTATLKTVTLVSPAYLQVLEVCMYHVRHGEFNTIVAVSFLVSMVALVHVVVNRNRKRGLRDIPRYRVLP